MSYKKLFLLFSLIAVCFNCLKVHAQGGGSKLSSDLDHTTVAQENLLSVLSKSEVGYNGLPDISIPIYTVKMDGTEIPIVLRYNPNSTRVDNKASWVGYGWDLDIGGNVSRIVNGTPDDVVITDRFGLIDDLPSNNRIVQPIYGYGVLGAKNIQNYDWASDPNTPYKRALLFKNLANTSRTWNTRMGIYNNEQAINGNPTYGALFVGSVTMPGSGFGRQNTEGIDTEPDIFSYDLFGRRGKFVFHYNPAYIPISGGSGSGPDVQAATTADLHMEAVTIPYDNISINWELDPATLAYTGDISQKYNLRDPFQTGGAKTFEIKDDEGRLFTFSVLDSTYVTHPYRKFGWNIGCGISDRVHNDGNERLNLAMKYTSKWSVQQMRTTNGRMITFDYYRDTTYSFSSFSKVIPYYDLNTAGIGLDQRNEDATSTAYGHVNSKIRRIETDKEIVLFMLSSSKRLDVRNSYQLDKVIVYEKTGTEVTEKFRTEFNYDYFAANSDNMYDNSSHEFTPSRPFGESVYLSDAFDKKLKLTGITFKSGTEAIPYTFTYNNGTTLIPRRGAVTQDLYGYYNHATENNIGGSHPYMYPKLYVYPNKTGIDRYTINRRNDWVSTGELEYVLSGANRESNFNMDIATLRRINNPFGGYIEYVYEPNEYLWPSGNIKGGGMRINKIEMNPGIVGLADVVRSFTYNKTSDPTKTSGKLLHYPIVAMGENHCGYDYTNYSYTLPSSYSKTSLAYIKKFTWRLENPSFSTCIDAGESIVGYNEISEYTSFGQNGKKVTSYWLPGGSEVSGVENNYVSQNTGIEAMNSFTPITRMISGGGYWESPASSGNGRTPPPGEAFVGLPVVLDIHSSLDLGGLDFSPYSLFSGSTVNLSWARGLLSGTKYYDNLGNLIQDKRLKYKIFTPNSTIVIPCLKQGVSQNYSTSYYNQVDNSFAFNNKYYSYYSQVANVRMVLDSVITEDYGQGGNTSAFKTVLKNEYSTTQPASFDFYPKKITTYNSNSEKYITHNTYPRDFQNAINGASSSSLGGVDKLLISKKYNYLIESWQELIRGSSSTVIGGSLYAYTSYVNAQNAGPIVSNVYAFRTAVPVSNFIPANISGSGSGATLNWDNKYIMEFTNNFVDYRGLTKQVNDNITNKQTATIIGSNDEHVIALADNASLLDIAYSGFEDLYPGWGTINDIKGNWDFDPQNIVVDATSPGGEKAYTLFSSLGANKIQSVNTLPNGKNYVLGFWVKGTPSLFPTVSNGWSQFTQTAPLYERNGWKYYEYYIGGSGAKLELSLQGGGQTSFIAIVDEIRLYPIGARMQTFTYDKRYSKPTSIADEAGRLTSFEYDDFGRLIRVRDEHGNITKENTIKYQSAQ